MPVNVPVPTKSPGDVLTSALFNDYIAANLNKLLNTGHRVLTVAQFAALTAPEDGDEVYLEVDATNGIVWHLRYVAAETTYKWRFLGGPALLAEVSTTEGFAASDGTTYQDTATVGPTVTTPRAGDYDVHMHADTRGSDTWVSPNIGGVAPADADGTTGGQIDGSGSPHKTAATRTKRKTALAASAAVKLQMKTTNGGLSSNGYTWQNRQLGLTPVRIS